MRRSMESKAPLGFVFSRLRRGNRTSIALLPVPLRRRGSMLPASSRSATIEGNKVLVKLADNPFTKRARIYMGPTDMSNYTVEADFRAIEKRRQLGDAGVVAQRYNLVLFGSHQRLELESWQPETKRTVSAPFQWKGDIWYHIKLRVEPAPNNKVVARGKVWAKSDPEPDKWQVERTDEFPEHQGSPGLYADAPFEVFFDNVKVTPNR